jgi:hypothetical protein|nr:MAG TPA: hypothetical protein [Caudoviricetes sp.]
MNDKEGCKWLLQKLYDRGLKYIVFDSVLGRYFGVDKIPVKNGVKWNYDGIIRLKIGLVTDLIPDFNEPNYLDVGKYLGIVDWSKVSKDTPILVSNDNKEWKRRYFAQYKNGKVVAYGLGATSWSSGCILRYWDYAKLAGGDDEK